jgi:hypothetical protein
MAKHSIAQYADLLRIRKHWAQIWIVATGIGTLTLLIAGIGLLWTKRLEPVTGVTALLIPVLFIYPLIGLVSQIVEYRRTSGFLELLDALEREQHPHASASRNDP